MRHRTIPLLAVAALCVAAAANPVPPESAPWKNSLTYGRDLMTREERRAYRVHMRSLKTYDEQLKFWRSHVAAMKKRAWERGLPIEEPPEVRPPEDLHRFRLPIYGQELMTTKEIEAYRAKERSLIGKGDAAMDAFLTEHEQKMKERAWERGLSVEETRAERKAAQEHKAEANERAREAMAAYQAAHPDEKGDEANADEPPTSP